MKNSQSRKVGHLNLQSTQCSGMVTSLFMSLMNSWIY